MAQHPSEQEMENAQSKYGSSSSNDDLVPAIPKKDAFDDDTKPPFLTLQTFAMTVLVSMGGICFGYDTGQISGFQEMYDWQYQFGDIRSTDPPTLSQTRTAIMVSLLSIGTLIGALIAGPIANNKHLGRKYSICIWCVVLSIGNLFQIAVGYPYWYVHLIGRIIAGLGVGGLSVVVPAFQGEASPTHVRGAVVSCYQLFITIGILIANLVNFGTNELTGPVQWRLPVGLGWLWTLIMSIGILFFPETPRHEFRLGKVASATRSIAKYYGVSERHQIVRKQLEEMQEKLRIEREEGEHSLAEVFTGPRMMYRILLGMTIQALQQLTGMNFFMYFGTTLFSSVGLPNSFVTQIILGAVNVVCTFPGLYMVEKFGRRKCLTFGATWMFICFMVYASLGQFALNPGASNAAEANAADNNQAVGYVMIVFACLFIMAFASTWGPMAWAVTSEIYPSRYRSMCISLCAASNWIFNFYIAFSTSYVVDAIGFAYGYVFAACNFVAILVVFFFLPETSGKSLEEIDTLFLLRVKPWRSSNWSAPTGDELLTADRRASQIGTSGKLAGDGMMFHEDMYKA